MPNENTQFAGKVVPAGLVSAKGSLAIKQSAYASGSPGYEAYEFIRWSGTTDIPDIAAAQASNVTALSAGDCPKGCRPYVTDVCLQMLGVVPWSNTSPTAGAVPALYLQDSVTGVPVLTIPFGAMDSQVSMVFPVNETRIPIYLGESTVNTTVGTPAATFTYVQATGVITASGTMFVSGVGVGSIAQVVQGAGLGQVAVITAITGTTVTVSPAFTGIQDHANGSPTSVIAIHAQTIKTATSTSVSVLQNAAGTTFTANAFAGLNVVGVLGTGQGQIVPVLSSTTAGGLTYGFALNTNFDTTTSMVAITDNASLAEVIQTGINSFMSPLGAFNFTTNAGSGLNWVVNNQAGTSPLGSNIRWGIKGFFAP